MCIRKRTLTVWGGIAVVVVALLAGVWGLRDASRPASAQVDPAELFQQAVDALDDGDVDAVTELFADDAVFMALPLCYPVECVGTDAIRNIAEYLAAVNARTTITSVEVSGNTIAGTGEGESDATQAAGVDRILASWSVEVTDDKITEYRCEWDFTDPETAEFIAYEAGNSIGVELAPAGDADQSPQGAGLVRFGSRTGVFVRIVPGPAGVPQPVNIHEGTCANLGAAALPLQDMGGGISATLLDVPLSDLQTGNYAINVQKSEAEPDTYVACGDIPAAAPVPPPVQPAPAPEVVIAPAPAIAPSTGSGGLLGEEDGGIATWWYALAAGGALLVVVGLAGLRRSRSWR